ncbi:hypothetical protein [Polyangium mundeleinium]|uniref:Tetratricopeptide repeat protein n=1 Tax=Polyangium mundeleinium TaxID=2995306 RepID=A0ABT5EPM8_9BACT|nr:hypothetical protein [Polyangium mundeleinium]MDC0743706.1 hypothetical protein [Polyangium mundeleinium]
MAKDKKTRHSSLDPEDVLTGRSRPEARDLVTLIREVNPTDRGLDRRETARRYALKNRLQSMLVTRFREAIEIRPEPGQPGVVLLHHRPSGLDACHAVIAELDDDARSFVQHVVDTAASPAPLAPEAPRKTTPRPSEGSRPSGALPDLLRAAEEALAEYDYELARTHLEEALAQSGGDTQAAIALLSLLVATLGIDAEALALEATLPAETLTDVHVRLLLALAAARLDERARALRLLPAANAKAPPARVAEVFVALARSALTTGDLASAADDITRARALDVTHPELVGLADALAKARATTRGPAEAEASRLFAEGDLHGAEERAREILAHHPESEVARRILRAVEEQKKRDEARRKLDDACDALDRGAPQQAVALLEAAKGLGLPEHEAATVEQRIAVMLAAARAQEEEAHAATIARAIGTGAIAEGLAAYLTLPAPGRGRVKALAGSKLLPWMDVVAPPGEGAKGKPAVAAIVALHRATELAERSPEMAIELLDAHGKVLQGFAPAEDVRKRAQAALADERRRVATGRIEAARRVMEEGDVAQANKLLGEVQRKDLPEDEASAFDRFRAEVQRKLERQTLAASLAELRREGDALRALAVCEELAARVEGEDVARIAALRGEIRAEVRRQFSVQVKTFEGGQGPAAALHDARIIPRWKWETMLVRTRDGREEVVLIVPQTRGAWVFLRVIDAATGKLRARITLRSPDPIELLAAALRDRRLILVGRRASLLEIDTDDWTVERWCRNVLCNGTAVTFQQDNILELTLPQVHVEEALITPEGRWLWINTMASGSIRRILSVFDLEDLRLVREIREHRSERVSSGGIPGLKTPRVVVSESSEKEDKGRTCFYSSRGAPSGDPTFPTDALSARAVVACPDGERILGITSDPEGPMDPHAAWWGFVEIDARGVRPLRLFEGVTAVYEVTAIGSLDAKMCFVLFDLKDDGPLLFGLRDEEEGLAITYRVRVPRRSLLAGTADGRRAALVVLHDGHHEIVPLGPEPPRAAEGPIVAPFTIPTLPRGSLHTRHLDCHQPAGENLTAAIKEERVLRREGRQGLKRRLEWARRKAGPDEILAFEHALKRLHDMETAGYVNKIACERFPDHPRIRLSYTRTLGSLGQWREIVEHLADIDPSRLREPSDVKHFHHMRGIALMMLDKPEAALVELERSAACKEGACEPEEILPLCVPLSDEERSWTPEQAVKRDYLRIVVTADEALARGDAAAAQRILDVPLLWEANEIQSMARLSEACLRAEEGQTPMVRFRKALALLSFCELFDARGTLNRREMPLPRATWDAERLSALAAKARAWVEEALRLPA